MSRRWWTVVRTVVAASAATVVLLPAAVPAQSPDSPQPPPPAASDAPADAAVVFGVDMAATPPSGGSPAHPATVAPAGVGWVRIVADWSVLESRRGSYVWNGLDAEIREAAASGRRVLVLLQNTPRWAALTPDEPPEVWRHQPPQRIADWTAFVTAVVSRYRNKVAAWQVEPALELSVFRGTFSDYEGLLRAASGVIRREAPQAVVVAASTAGLDPAFLKAMVSRDGGDFNAVMLYPKGRTPEDLLEALGVIRTRVLAGTRHQLWLTALPQWGAAPRMGIAALAGGVSLEFWPSLDSPLATTIRLLGTRQYVGPIYRGPGVYAFAFSNGPSPLVALWSAGAPSTVPLATAGPPALIAASGQVPASAPEGGGAGVPAGPDPVFVSNPAQSVIDEAAAAARRGPFVAPHDTEHDFSKADSVSATLGAATVERGLYNEQLRRRPGGGVVPVAIDGRDAVRMDVATGVVYVYFDVDHTFAYFDDGRYDLVISVEVHKASAPERVGFNVFYDSMSGYRFTPWQWVDAGSGWTTYAIRLTDASFSSAWGWDFALNGAGNRRENLIVRSVTVTKVPR